MNAELQKQLSELLSKLMDVAGDAAKVAGDQIPPLVQEKIAFGRAYELLAVLGSAALCVGLMYLVKVFHRVAVAADDMSGTEIGGVVATVASFAGAVVFGIAAIANVEPLLMVWLAPRLYIVEWLRGMAR